MASLKERLRAFLGLDTSEFDRGLDRSGRRVRSFGQQAEAGLAASFSRMSGLATGFIGGLGAGLVTTALSSITTDLAGTVKAIAQLGDEAKRSGIGLQAFQEWKFVAEQNRIGVDQLVDGFKELSLRADEWIVTGGGAAADAFKRLGYSADDLRTKLKDPSGLMLEIIGRLESMDKAAQIRITDEIFGGSAGERFVELLGQGEDGLRALINQAHESGAVLDAEVISKADALDRKFGEVGSRVSAMWKNMVLEAAEAIGLITTLQNSFGSDEFAKAIVGSGSYEELRDNLQLLEEQARSIDNVRARFLDLDVQVSALLPELQMFAGALERAGEIGAAEVLRGWISSLEEARQGFVRGTVTAEEFGRKVDQVQSGVTDLVTELGDVNGVDLSRITERVGLLARALEIARGVAAALKASLPSGGYVSSGRGDGSAEMARRREDLNPWKADPNAPGTRPRAAPTDTWWIDPTGTGTGSGKGKRDRHSLSGVIESTRTEIAEMEAEAAVLMTVASGNRQLGDAMEYARKKAELLAAAKREGKEITPELAAEIDNLALAYMTAGLNAEEAADRIDNIREASERGKDAMTDLFGSILEGSDSAKRALANLLMEIAKVQFSRAMFGLLGGTSWGRSLITDVGLSIGKNANGTTNWAGGLTMVGERGAELVSLPRGSQVFSNADSQRMLSGANRGASITVYSDPSVVVRAAEGAAVRVVQRAAPEIVSQAVGAARYDASENPWP